MHKHNIPTQYFVLHTNGHAYKNVLDKAIKYCGTGMNNFYKTPF